MLENARHMPLPQGPCSGMPHLPPTATGSLPCFSDGFASMPLSHSLHGSQPCHGEGACITQWSYEPLPCRVTQDGQVTVKSSDKAWSTGEENGNLLHYSCLENLMDSMKRQKGTLPEDACLIQWPWIWANSRRWWGTEEPGMLQSMGSPRVR